MQQLVSASNSSLNKGPAGINRRGFLLPDRGAS
jgi:hypothetical protein